MVAASRTDRNLIRTKIKACMGVQGCFSNISPIFTHMNTTRTGSVSWPVEELRWALTSQPLMMDSCWLDSVSQWPGHWSSEEDVAHILEVAESDKADLSELFSHPSGFIGKRFERILHYCFTHHPGLELAGSGMVIQQDKQTIGEIDFLLRHSATGDWIHVESACKYYLGNGNRTSWSSWLGVNPEDSLERKISTLVRQLDKSRLREILRTVAPDESGIVHSVVLMKGYFFVPFDLLAKSKLPHHAHRSHSAGWWMHQSQMQVISDLPAQWIVLPRDRWIAPWRSLVHEVIPLGGIELRRQVHDVLLHYPGCLVAQVFHEGDEYRELSRGMIVPDHWPGKR
jgi:hypothetical protein